ncbi:MAG: ribosome-binding factor A [Candidatus Riflebacteria bacterium]|nr:ribosome-binding factor A [Candidatus Riflebacteria bacterium]
MKHSENRSSKPFLRSGQSYFDDGVDSKITGRSLSRPGSTLHEGGLCRQVEEVLSLVFCGSSSDERLWDLGLLSVELAPNSSRLLVKIYPLPHSEPRSVTEIHAILKSARPFMKREIAESICRKRTPELVFEIVPGPGGDFDEL